MGAGLQNRRPVARKKKPKPPERRKKTASRPARAPFVEMVIAPEPWVCCAPPDWNKEAYVWDLDRTYLRTEFESLRDLIRTAFQRAKDKTTFPGVTSLIRALRVGPDAVPRPVYFVSASPPQIRKVIKEKFALDKVEVDGIYFKDNIRNVRPSRYKRLREQVGYKLLALIDLKAKLPPGTLLTCFGDDYESDAVIYSLFAEICERWIKGIALVEFLKKQGVFHDEAVRIAWKARRLPPGRAVGRIFINLLRDQDPRYYRRFGSRVTATRNYFQTAAVCFADGAISIDGLADVGAEMIAAKSFNQWDLAGALQDLLQRRVIGDDVVSRLAPRLVERKVLPVGFP